MSQRPFRDRVRCSHSGHGAARRGLRATGCKARKNGSARAGLAGLTSTAIAVAVGSNSCSTSSRFGPTSTPRLVTPVRFPPGWIRLATSPALTGSTATAKTVGTVVVAALAATAVGVPPPATSTVTGRRASSVASAGSRLFWPSAQRYSIATFWPSTYPDSFNPCWNARRRTTYKSGEALLRKPMTGIAGCWACAASGHAAAAPPRSDMNSRRLIASPRLRTRHGSGSNLH